MIARFSAILICLFFWTPKVCAEEFSLLTTVGFNDQLTCLGISPHDPNFVIIGTSEGTILRTFDGGATWRDSQVTPPRVAYYGRERPEYYWIKRDLPVKGAKKSRQLVQESLQKEENIEYALGLPGKSPHLQNWLYSKGLNTSGRNLQQYVVQRGDQPIGVNWIDFDHKDKNIVYAATMDGVYRSTDKGLTFIRLWQGHFGSAERIANTIAVDPGNSNRIFVGTSGGLFYSEDKGVSFKPEMNFYVHGGYVRGLYTDPQQPGLVHMAMGGAAMATPDSGKTWITTHWDLWGPRSSIQWISLGPDNIRLIGTQDGLYVSFQGGEMGSWKRRGYKFVAQTVNTTLATSDPAVWYVTTDQAVWKTNDHGNNWRKVFNFSGYEERPNWIASYKGDSKQIWVLTNRHVYRSGKISALHTIEKNYQRQPRLLDIPTLSQLWLRIRKHNQLYFSDIQKYRRRANWAALLPSLWATGYYEPSGYLSLRREFPHLHWDYVYRNTQYRDNFGFEVIATWDLGRLIYDRQSQPFFGRVERTLSSIIQELSARVFRLYREYKTITYTLAYAPPANIKTRELKEIRLQEISAYFDGISNGFWSEAKGRN